MKQVLLESLKCIVIFNNIIAVGLFLYMLINTSIIMYYLGINVLIFILGVLYDMLIIASKD